MQASSGIDGGTVGMRKQESDCWHTTRQTASTYKPWQTCSIAKWSNIIGEKSQGRIIRHAKRDVLELPRCLDPEDVEECMSIAKDDEGKRGVEGRYPFVIHHPPLKGIHYFLQLN